VHPFQQFVVIVDEQAFVDVDVEMAGGAGLHGLGEHR